MEMIIKIFTSYSLVGAIMITAAILYVANKVAVLINQKRMGAAIAILIGLALAYFAGKYTGGKKGIADIAMFSGFGILGGGMMRDFAIISTAFGVKFEDLKKSGLAGVVSLFVGVLFSFFVGVVIAYIFGYRDAAELTTIGAGTVTFVVGPVTGGALGVSSEVIALSIAAGVVKSILTIIITPLVAKRIGLNNPTAAMIYGGLMGSTSGVAGGLAATDPALVPYGAMTATFYTGLGTLLCPSVLYLLVKLFV